MDTLVRRRRSDYEASRERALERTSNGGLFVFLEVVVDEAKDQGRLREMSVSTLKEYL